MSVNRAIYEQRYGPANVRLAPTDTYGRRLIEFRQGLLERHAPGRDVLDLGAGIGAYLIPLLPRVRRAYALDFSRKMLHELRREAGRPLPCNLVLLEADARAIPLPDESVDFAFSFTTLYHVPDVEHALAEVARVLRPGGVAALELGNLHSLNTIVCNYHHLHSGWAKPFHIPYRRMREALLANGLAVEEHRVFQLLPMFGGPKRYFYLYPLLSPAWRSVMGLQVRGRVLDEIVSGAWLLKHLAFRHFFVVRHDA